MRLCSRPRCRRDAITRLVSLQDGPTLYYCRIHFRAIERNLGARFLMLYRKEVADGQHDSQPT